MNGTTDRPTSARDDVAGRRSRRRRARTAHAPVAGLVALLALAAIGLALAAPAIGAAEGDATADGVVVAPFDFRSADRLIARLEAAGAAPRVVFLPRTVVAGVSPEAAVRLAADGFSVMRAGASPPADAEAATRRALDLLDALASPQPWTVTRTAGERPSPPSGDVRYPWRGVSTTAGGGSAASAGPLYAGALADPFASPVTSGGAVSRGLPRATEPAAFAAGSVAVSIIFTESNGAKEADREDWDEADPDDPGDRRANVIERIVTACAWWSTREPLDGLVFVIPAPGAPGAPKTVATGYEPVRHAGVSDALWRHPLMKNLGFPAEPDDVPPPERGYDDAIRTANGTDWAMTLYVVDSLNDADGKFSDGLFAYTFALYGPYSVLTYDIGGYGAEDLAPVLTHELGHVFGALDEYAPPVAGYPSTGDLFSGYLWVKNRNAVVGGTTDHACLMRGGTASLQAYVDGELCPSTRGQAGWRDTDADGIPDVVDTLPRLNDGPQTEAGGQVTFTGGAAEVPWPRGRNARGSDFSHDISIFVPHDVVFRVDEGGPLPVEPVDGAFDRPTEAWTLTTPALADGHHVVSVSATTGTTATLTRDVWVGPVPVSLTLAVAKKTLVIGQSVKVQGTATSSGYPIPFLGGIAVGPDDGPLKVFTADRVGFWSGYVKPRFSGEFAAAFETAGQYVGPAVSPEVAIGVKPLIRARLASARIARGKVMAIDGTFRPRRSGVPVVLQITRNDGAAWANVTTARTKDDGSFHFGFRAARKGTVKLRVRFAGDEKNLAAVRELPRFTVH